MRHAFARVPEIPDLELAQGVGAWICRKSSNFSDLRQTSILEITCYFKCLEYPCTNALLVAFLAGPFVKAARRDNAAPLLVGVADHRFCSDGFRAGVKRRRHL